MIQFDVLPPDVFRTHYLFNHEKLQNNDINLLIHSFVGFDPRSKKRLQKAVDEWCENRENAIITYGHISSWNTQFITNMNCLFRDKKYFNDVFLYL